MDKTIVQLQEDGKELQCQDGWKALHGRKGIQAGDRKRMCGGTEGAVGTAQGEICSHGAACLLLAGLLAICPD